MTPIEFGISRSKVKATVTFKLMGAYMFYKYFLLKYKLLLEQNKIYWEQVKKKCITPKQTKKKNKTVFSF